MCPKVVSLPWKSRFFFLISWRDYMGFEEVFGLTMILFLAVYGVMITAFTTSLFRIIKSGPGFLVKSVHHSNPSVPIIRAVNHSNPSVSVIRAANHTNPSVSVLKTANHTNPFVSVIIPIRNEGKHILRILEEMIMQDFPVSRMEILIADDFSEDETMTLAGGFASQFPGFPLVLVPPGKAERHETGKKRAIERAVKLAKGEILLFTDGDTFHGRGWITSMTAVFSAGMHQMVLGPVVFSNEKNLLQKIQSLELLGLMGTTAGSAGLGYPVMCNGANLAYRRTAFISTEGFSGNLRFSSGDDQFMMSSIRKQYGSMAISFNFDLRAVVVTEPESTLSGFISQRIRWVSKSRGYHDPVVITTGLATYLLHLLLLSGFIMGIWSTRILVLSMVLWIIKIFLEYPMVAIMMRFFRKQELHGYYFVAQIFQLLYVPLAGLLGLILPYSWKGRTGVR